MTRDVYVRVGWRFVTDADSKALVDQVAERCHQLRVDLQDEGLVVVGQIGPSVVPSMQEVLADEALQRWSARVGDSVDEELEYHRHRDEEALAQYESERHLPTYDPETDPLQGETSARYEEGGMP